MAKNNVWSQIKKQQLQQQKDEIKDGSVWSRIEQETEELAQLQGAYTPVVVNNEIPPGSISFDIETGSVDYMFSSGPEFLRLHGWDLADGTIVTDPDPVDMIEDIYNSDGWVIGHNIMNFDLILLDKHYGLSILELAKKERCRDTKIIAFLADPPYSRTKEGEIEKMYSLQKTGEKYLGEGKMVDVATGSSVLKKLAAEFGGFDKIPVDHPEYVQYLRVDVERTRDLVKVLPINDYTIREHKIAAVAATISIQGFRVDVPLLNERIRLGEEKKQNILESLQGYGLPSPESSKAPHRTNKGKEAIEAAFNDLGVSLPRTPGGSAAMGKDVLQEIIDTHGGEAGDLAEAVQSLNGIRTIYGNIHEYLVGDRVHPSINLRQSSGRWSIQKPGLTVIGKRGGKVIERAVFIPDNEDHVLISVDLAQVDARAVAALSQDIEYLKLFEEGRDLHSEMAVRLGLGNDRERAKAAAHGINYGMQAKKLAWTMDMDLYQAEEIVHNFYTSFPRLARWQTEVRETGQVVGVLYNGFGRMMRIESERAFTQSPALMGQSTARDILMEGVLRLWSMGGEDVIKMIRAVVHDELVVSVHKNDAEEMEHLLVDALSFPWCPVGGTYPVQIEAGLQKNKQGTYNRGKSWAACYDK